MAGPGCRVSIHVDGADTAQTVDLALPRRACLGDMLPSIVELVRPDHREAGARWRLHRIDGSSLDESLTLPDNHVRDGEVLWLTADDIPDPVFTDRDATRTVARRQPAPGAVPRVLCATGGVVATGIGGTALLWSTDPVGRTLPVLIGAALTCAAVTAAAIGGRTHSEPLLCTTLSVIAVMMAVVTGTVAVPGGPLAAHVLLASSAALAIAAVSLRLTSRGLVPLAAIATTSLLCTAASAASVAWRLGGTASGALLAALALATLSLAPRLAIALTGIGPAPPDDDMDCLPDFVEESEAARAHDLLTAMVAGASTAAAIAAMSVGYGSIEAREVSVPAAAFDGVVGAALFLRTRTHIGTARRAALAASGFVALTAAFVILAVAFRQHAHWLGALAAVAGTGLLVPHLQRTPAPAARRAAELAEYAALAAVIPLGCWIAGVFGLVRNLALT
ncbi:type VII secretion integral membrane protein EccD [Mycolicibacterium sp. XJ1904]